MLDAIRQYNHAIVDSLHSIKPLYGLKLLDVGASPHGYALEKCLLLGAKKYVGIGLDIHRDTEIRSRRGSGTLTCMNAENLDLEDNSFDAIVTMSTFEHISNLPLALSEFHRVLKPGGHALITFEPIWTCSYGHHLHHLGNVAALVPAWSHLLWSQGQMHAYLRERWPADASLTVDEACRWIYEGDALNRLGIRRTMDILQGAALQIEWIMPLLDDARDEKQLQSAMAATNLTREELMTKGLSVLMRK